MSEEAPKYTTSTMSRRRFLSAVGGIIVGGLTGIDVINAHTNRPSISRGLVEGLETGTFGMDADQMKTEVENKYGIILISPDTNLSFTSTNDSIEFTKNHRVHWDAPRIKALSKALDVLPPFFYQPRETSGRLLPLAVSLADWDLRTPQMKNKGGLYCRSADNSSGLIFFNKKSLGQSFLEQDKAKQNIVHEFVHRAIDPRLNSLEREVMQVLEIEDERQLQSIFKTEKLNQYVAQQESSSGFELTQTRNKPRPSSTQIRIMYGGIKLTELLAVAGEQFTRGREEFLEGYVEFIGQEKAAKLYEFVKKEIYEGREY